MLLAGWLAGQMEDDRSPAEGAGLERKQTGEGNVEQ
jgi:hypothetical protein